MRTILTDERAAALARAALGSAPDGPFDGPGGARSFWALARLLRRFPALALTAEIRALFDRCVTPGAVADALAPLPPASAQGFDGLTGWAWLLKLAAELRELDDADAGWGVTLAPLAEACADRVLAALPRLAAPVRAGTEDDTAFAMALIRDYALSVGDDALLGLLWQRAVDWYGRGRRPEGTEGGAALSPALVEAECLRGLLPAGEWRAWLDAALPDLARGEPEALFRPAAGERAALNLGRAWCWRGLAARLPAGDPRRTLFEQAAERHLAASLGAVAASGGLASLALLALEA